MVVVVGVDKFEDPTFDLEKASNQIGSNVEIYRPPENYVFIRNGIRESDINQGALGSCWLLSTIGSFAARYDQRLLENVLNVKFNQKNGPREGKLVFRFYRFNKFEDVIIDDQLPLVEHKMADDSRDWWVPLVEKAYAKFYDSYRNIDGGYPRVSSFNLTGGVCVDINSEKLTSRLYTTLSRLIVELYQTGRVCLTCGNKGDRQGHAQMEMGIVPWHAYSVLSAKRASTKDGKKVYLIQIRNPHGYNSDEWRGRWSDRDANRWSTLVDEEFHNERDGTFWMEMSEFFDYFELTTICLLPTTWSDQHQIDIYGVFDEGLNVPYDTYTKHMIENNLQFLLVIPPEDAPDVELWMQLVLDLHELRDFASKQISLNIYGQSSTQRLDLQYMKRGGYRRVFRSQN